MREYDYIITLKNGMTFSGTDSKEYQKLIGKHRKKIIQAQEFVVNPKAVAKYKREI